jgi:hypothetical protein
MEKLAENEKTESIGGSFRRWRTNNKSLNTTNVPKRAKEMLKIRERDPPVFLSDTTIK